MPKFNNRIFLILVLLGILVFSSLTVYGGGDVLRSRIRLGADISTMDPAHAVREYDIDLILYSRLLRYKPGSSELVPDAAESVDVSEDGKTISFKLKEGIQFHKGYGELTAEDVKFSFERIIDPEEASEYAADWKTLDHVEVTGKYTGEIILKEPFAPLFVTTLPFTPGSIVSKKAVEELGERFATNPVGSGPYYWEEWVPEQKVVLKRFDDYFDDLPDFKRIELFVIQDKKVAEMNFDRGDLDVTEISLDSIERYKNNPDVDLHLPSTLKYSFIGFNHEFSPFDDIRVREAVRYAIDVDMILAGALNNVPERSNSMIAPGILGYWKDAPRYDVDLEKARDLLEEAGYGDGFSIEMVSSSDPESMNVAQIVKENLKKVGIDVNIKIIETASWYPYLGQESHPCIFYESFSLTLDPGYWVEWFTTAQVGKWNFIKWSSEEFDQLASEATVTMDSEKRAQMYIRMQEIMDEEAALIWVTNGAKVYVSNKAVEPVFLGHYNQYRYWEKTD